MKSVCCLLAFLISCSISVTPQGLHLVGKIKIDLPRGIFSGDVCLSNLPKQQRLSFLLNHGLNIKSVRDGHGKLLDCFK